MRNKLASSIAILLNYRSNWKIVYYVFYVLSLDFELSIILDQHLDWNLVSGPPSTYRKNFIVETLSTLNLSSNLPLVPPWFLISILIILIAILVLYLTTVYRMTSIWMNLKQSKIAASLSISVATTSKFWMLIVLYLVARSLTCISTKIEGSTKSLIELNPQIKCQSASHFIIVALCLVLLLFAALAFHSAQKIKSFIPRANFCSMRSKWGETVALSTFTILLAINTLLVNFHRNDHKFSDLFFIITLVLLLSKLVLLLLVPIYHSEHLNFLNIVKIGLHVLLVVWIRISSSRSLDSRVAYYSMHITGLLILGLGFRIMMILAEKSRPKQTEKTWSVRSFQRLYIVCNQYLENVMTSKDAEKVRSHFLKDLMDFYTTNHKIFAPDDQFSDSFSRVLKSILRPVSLVPNGTVNKKQVESKEDTNLKRKPKYNISDFKAHYPSLNRVQDTFVEEEGRSTKPVIALLNLITSNIEVKQQGSDEDELIQVEAIKIIHNLNYNGRVCLAVQQLKALERSKSGKKEIPFAIQVLNKFTSLRLEENLGENSLLAAWVQPLNSQMKIGSSKSHSLATIVDFTNRINCISDQIKDLLVRMTRILEIGELDGFTSYRLFNESKHSIIKCKKIGKSLKKLDVLVGGKSIVVQLQSAFFNVFIANNLKEGYSQLRSLSKKKFPPSHSKIVAKSSSGTIEFDIRNIDSVCVIGASGEPKDLHKITYVSSNIQEILNFFPEALKGEDLSKLIPEPIASKHKDFFIGSKSTGRIFSLKHEEDIMILDRSGHFRKIGLMVRINPLLDSASQFISKINFIGRQETKPELLLNENLRITAVNKHSSVHFLKGSYIHQYQQTFQAIGNDFLRTSQMRRTNPNIDVWTFAERNEELHEMRKYYALRLGKELSFINHKGKLENIKFNLIDIHIRAIDQTMILMQYEVMNHEIYSQAFKDCVMPVRRKLNVPVPEDPEKVKQREEVRSFAMSLEEGDRKYMKMIQYMESMGYFSKDIQFNLNGASGKNNLTLISGSPEATSKVPSFKSESARINSQINESGAFFMVSENDRFKKFERLAVLINHKLLNFGMKELMHTVKHPNNLQSKRFSEHIAMRSRIGEMNRSDHFRNQQTSDFMYNTHLSETLKSSIHHSKYNIGLRYLLILTLLIVIIKLFIGVLKFSQSRKLNLELADELQILKWNTESIYHSTEILAYLDLTSAVNAGTISDDYFSNFLSDSSILDNFAKESPQLNGKLLEDRIKVEHYLGKVDHKREMEIASTIRITNNTLSNLTGTQNEFTQERTLDPSYSFRFIQPMLNMIFTMEVANQTLADRDIVSYVRENLQNGILQYQLDLSELTEEKVGKIAKSSLNWMIYSLVSSFGISFILIGLWLGFLFYIKNLMDEWIDQAFSFKLIEIKKAKEFIQSLTKKYQIIVEDARSAHETITYNIGWISESSSKIQEGPKTPKLSSAKPRNQDSMLPLGSSSRKMHNNSKLKITVNTKNQTYGTFKVVVLLSVFCLALNWYEVLTSYGVLRSLVKVNGEVYTYKSLSRILTTHRTVLASLNSMTVWQNSLSVLHSPSKNTLEMNLKKYSSVDSKEWNEIQDKNLGDFRNQYDESSKNFNYCGSWLKQVYPKIKGCGVGSASILNGSLDRVLDQINSEIGFIVNSASTGNYNQLWSDLKFKTIQFYSVYLSLKKRSISAKMLNTIMNPLFDFLYNNLENDILGETTILTHLLLSLVVYLLVFILIGTYLRKSLENIGNYFFGTLLILPIQLLSTNPWISNKVKHRYLLVY